MEITKVNFSREETQKLKELVEHNKYALFNKKNNAVSNRLKEESWNSIAEEFNACSSTYRSVKQLKYKFDNMKHLARKELNKDFTENDKCDSLNPSLSSDAEWLRGLMNVCTGGSGPEIQADTTQMTPLPESRKREKTSPPQMRKKLSSLYEMKNRILHNRETLVRKENMLLLSHLEELHKQEMAHKAERHHAELEHETRLNEAQLNKLAVEAKLYEAQLNKVALESKQLEAQQAREAELHAVRMAREAELHEARLVREAKLHAALIARETGTHLNRI